MEAVDSPWRKSSYSGTNGGDCVEVAARADVLVRDSTNRSGLVLSVSADAWRAFTGRLKSA
jgi:hypothetical protein